MDNMERIIKQHNNKVLSTPAARPKSGCNCRKKDQCPLSNNCLTPSLIYRAHVKTDTDSTGKSYIGLTEGPFKQRYNNHTLSFRDRKRENSTELSKYVWKLKDEHTSYKILDHTRKSRRLQQQDKALQLMPDGKTSHH